MPPIESDISGPVLEEILGLVYKHTGITMTEKKKTLLQGRLTPRLRELSLSTYKDYVSYFSAHPEEAQEFINLVTTNETLFFRTQQVWDYFSGVFLPQWVEKSDGKVLRIWSAAASSGEEAYSIAMACKAFQEKNPKLKFQIVGTDISTEVLAHAEKAIYSGRAYNDLKARNSVMATKYLTPVGDDRFQIRPELRALVRFGTHSLFDPAKSRDSFDIVFLRNVMIYFSVKDQERVLKQIAPALVTGGTLILGESESLARFETPFNFVAPLIYKKGGG